MHRYIIWQHASRNKSVDDIKSPETEYRQDAVYMARHQAAACHDSAPDHNPERNFYQHILGSQMLEGDHWQRTKVALHIKRLAGRFFYHVWQLARSNAHSTLMQWRHLLKHSSQVVLTAATDCLMAPVQFISIQSNPSSTPPHLTVKKQKYNHIMATIRDELHWLPMQQRLVYKLCNFVYKCFHHRATAPSQSEYTYGHVRKLWPVVLSY